MDMTGDLAVLTAFNTSLNTGFTTETISLAQTSLSTPPPSATSDTTQEKKPVKKRKSWGQELPTPKTNLPPR